MFEDDEEIDDERKKKHTFAKLTRISQKIANSLEVHHYKLKSELDDSIKAGVPKADMVGQKYTHEDAI